MERQTWIVASSAIVAVLLFAFMAVAPGAQTAHRQIILAPGGNPAIVSQYGAGYMVSNITLINPFTVSLNGTKLKIYASYINVNSTGIIVNGSLYALYLDSPVLIKSTPNVGIYSELENVSYYTKNRTVKVYIYSSAISSGPLLAAEYTLTSGHPVNVTLQSADSSINFSTSITTPLSIRIYNITNTTEPPKGYSSLVVLGINTSSNSSVNVSMSMGYPCSLKPPSVAPMELAANGTWVQIPAMSNIIGCLYRFRIVRDLVIGSVNMNYTVGLFARSNNTNQSTSATTAATTMPSTIASTTIMQSQPSGISASTVVEAIFAVVVVVAILYYALDGAKRKPQRSAKEKQTEQK